MLRIFVVCLLWVWCVTSSRTMTALPSSEVKKSNNRKTQLANFLAGGLAGTISSTLTMPLEIVKTQLQSSRIGKSGPRLIVNEILKKEGPKGFFKGLQPMIIGIVPTRAIYFWAYSTTKTSLKQKLGDTPANHILSAFAAGIASNTVMNPLWMVKTRFQIMADASVGQKVFKNYQDVAGAIWREEGAAGFFKGITASYVGCFEGAIQWIVYEKLKSILTTHTIPPPFSPGPIQADPLTPSSTSSKQHRFNLNLNVFNQKAKQMPVLAASPVLSQQTATTTATTTTTTTATATAPRTPTPGKLFLAAAAAKCIAVLATYPHEVVRTRLREQATQGVFKYQGFFGALSTIAKEEGRRGLYSGMGMHLLRSVPNAAVMFLSYELASNWLDQHSSLLNGRDAPTISAAETGGGPPMNPLRSNNTTKTSNNVSVR